MQLEKVEINPRKSAFYWKGQINFNCNTWLFVLAFSCGRLSFFLLVLFVSEPATKAYSKSRTVLSNITKTTADIFPFTGSHWPRVFWVYGFYDFCLSAGGTKKKSQKKTLAHFRMINGAYCTCTHPLRVLAWCITACRARAAPGGMNCSFCSPAPHETLSAGAQGFKSPLPHRSRKMWFCDSLQPPPNARGAGRRSTPLTSLPPSAGCYQPSHQAINWHLSFQGPWKVTGWERLIWQYFALAVWPGGRYSKW